MLGYYWDSTLDETVFREMLEFFVKCKMENEDALVIVSSEGGYIHYLKTLHEFIRDSGVHLTTLGMGVMYSAGSAFFCLGDERIIVPGTRVMIHNSLLSVKGKMDLRLNDVERFAKEIKTTTQSMIEAYVEKTKLTKSIISKKCRNGADWYLTQEEIEKYGLTTRSHEGWTDFLQFFDMEE